MDRLSDRDDQVAISGQQSEGGSLTGLSERRSGAAGSRGINHRIGSWFSRLVIAVGLVFLAAALLFACRNTTGFFTSGWQATGIAVLAAVCFLAVGYMLAAYVNRLVFVVLLVGVAAGLRLWWILNVNTQPVSDFLDMQGAAVMAAKGDFSFGQGEYFTRWVYQLGFAMYEALIVKLFGEPIIYLKLFNVLFNTGTALLVYLTAARVFRQEACGRLAGLFYALYVPNIVMGSVLTNQHLSTFLFFAGLYLVVKRGLGTGSGWWAWPLIGLSFGLGNVMRPLGSFFLVGFLVYAVLFELLRQRDGHARLFATARIAGVIAVYFAVQQIVSYSFISAGITEHKLSNPEPYWKLVEGLNRQTTGGWSWEDTELVLKYELGEARNQAELAIVKERIADKRELVRLFGDKFKAMWGGEDTAVFWSLYQIEKPELKQPLTQMERIGYSVALGFGLIALLALIRGNRHPQHTLYLVLLLGYAAVHIVIEIQTRYRFDIMPALIILQSFGMYTVIKLFARTFGRRGGSAAQ